MSVTVIGDAFVDVIVPVQGIKPGETHHRKILLQCGGTANVAVEISKLGETSKFVGKIGDDPFGNYFRQNLVTNGVKDLTVVDSANPTGLCISMSHDDGERAMVANRCANDYLEKEEIERHIDEIKSSKIVYFSGYSLLSRKNLESVLYAIAESLKQNCEIYFNPGAPNLIKEGFDEIVHDYVDLLILNIEEAKTMTKKDKIEGILKSLNKMVNTSIITMGRDGCIVSNGAHIETQKLNVMDTTGAGDAFSAGFIVGRLRDMDVLECAKLGNETAAKFLVEKIGSLR